MKESSKKVHNISMNSELSNETSINMTGGSLANKNDEGRGMTVKATSARVTPSLQNNTRRKPVFNIENVKQGNVT